MSGYGWLGVAFLVIAAAAFWVTAPIRAVHRKTRPSAMGGGKSAGYARNTEAAAKAKGAPTPEAADTGAERASNAFGATVPEGAWAALSGATPTVARALLTPDCPSLDSEWWRANPTEPLAPSEVVRWRGIVAHYEWVAPTAVVPGGES